MNMNFPLMVKIPENDWIHECLMPLTSISFVYNPKGIIDAMQSIDRGDMLGDALMATNGTKMKLVRLNCKTYEELIIQLELNDLIHGNINANDDPNADDIAKLKRMILKLTDENDELKAKIGKLQKVLNS